MTGMVISDLAIEREILFEYYIDRHQRVWVFYRIVVEKLVYYGLDCIEALQLRLLAEQGGDVAVHEAAPVVVGQVKGYDLDVIDTVFLKNIRKNISP